jgi:effector-binding domain-containing protein
MSVGLPISMPGEPVAEPEPNMDLVKLPGGEVAVAWHTGSYDGLKATWEALHDWIHGQGRDDVGEPWEVYWSSPADTPDPSAWRTQIVWPLGPKE